MVLNPRFSRLLWLFLLATLLLAACGDSTATVSPSTTAAATTTAASTTTTGTTQAASTTSAATTAVATTATTTSSATTTTTNATTSSATTAAVAGDAQAGKQIFVQNCQSCHLQGGTVAGTGPKLAKSREVANTTRVKRVVRSGDGLMPPFSTSQISDADLDKVVAYLKTLQ